MLLLFMANMFFVSQGTLKDRCSANCKIKMYHCATACWVASAMLLVCCLSHQADGKGMKRDDDCKDETRRRVFDASLGLGDTVRQ